MSINYETPFQTYDLVYGLTQSALNLNLKAMFSKLDDDQGIIKIGDLWAHENEQAMMRARLAPPQFDFIYGSVTKARLIIKFDTDSRPTQEDIDYQVENKNENHIVGNMFISKVFHGFSVGMQCFDCTDWQVVFDIDLNYAEYDLDSADVPASVREKMTAFDPEMFTVRRIFMDLTNINTLSLHKDSNIDIGSSEGLEGKELDDYYMRMANSGLAAQTLVAKHLAAMQKESVDKSFFDLGFAVVKRKTAPAAMFEPTGAVHSTKYFTAADGSMTRVEGQKKLSTLNFLMMCDHKDVEPRVETYGAFQSLNLVTDPQVHGKAVITRSAFHSKFMSLIWEGFTSTLLPDFDPLPFSGDRRDFHNPDDVGEIHRSTEPATGKDFDKNVWSLEKAVCIRGDAGGHDVRFFFDRRTFNMQVQNNKDDISIVGNGMLYFEFKYEAFDDFNHYQGKKWHSITTNFSLGIGMTAGADGKICITNLLDGKDKSGKPAKVPMLVDAATSDQSETGLVEFADTVAGWILDISDNTEAVLEKLIDELTDAMSSDLEKHFEDLRNRVIFPGPGEFFYKRLQISDFGDLELDVSIKAD